MCGIFGCIKCISTTQNIPILMINSLKLLLSRGYDSCGTCLIQKSNDIIINKYGVDSLVLKSIGSPNQLSLALKSIESPNQLSLVLSDLTRDPLWAPLKSIGSPNQLSLAPLKSIGSPNQLSLDIFDMLENDMKNIDTDIVAGIGHTRWATHGKKTNYNSHPHTSENENIRIVHNGIISNYDELKKEYLKGNVFKSDTDSEVIAHLINYFEELNTELIFEDILKIVETHLIGTWAIIISNKKYPEKLFFMKNENPLLIGYNDQIAVIVSEPVAFSNIKNINSYILCRDKTIGWINNKLEHKIYGEYQIIPISKNKEVVKLNPIYKHWMRQEISEQQNLSVLIDPETDKYRINASQNSSCNTINFNLEFIKNKKYLYIIGCGSSYYSALIASNYFRYTHAFEFINVYDGGDFSKIHLDAINNPRDDLLIVLISQSGETRDLNIATTICREYTNSTNILDSKDKLIPIIGIINVEGSLISRRTLTNIYTNVGRENAVASTKSSTAQIMACLLLAIYKSELCGMLTQKIKNKFTSDVDRLKNDIEYVLSLEHKIISIASLIIKSGSHSIFILGKDELYGSALEGALKIKEISYIHAEGFYVTALKHGPYAMIEEGTPIILLYKKKDHFIKSVVNEVITRGAIVIETTFDEQACQNFDKDNDNNILLMPKNKTFLGLLNVIVMQLLSYHLSIQLGINPDRPRNLAKVVTVD